MVLPQRLVSGAERKREVEIETAARREDGCEIERRRQYSDDGVGLVVDGQRRADDCGSASKRRSQKPSLNITAFGPFHWHLLRVKTRPSCGLHAEHVEEVIDTGTPLSTLGLPAAAEQVVADAVEREVPGQR